MTHRSRPAVVAKTLDEAMVLAGVTGGEEKEFLHRQWEDFTAFCGFHVGKRQETLERLTERHRAELTRFAEVLRQSLRELEYELHPDRRGRLPRASDSENLTPVDRRLADARYHSDSLRRWIDERRPRANRAPEQPVSQVAAEIVGILRGPPLNLMRKDALSIVVGCAESAGLELTPQAVIDRLKKRRYRGG